MTMMIRINNDNNKTIYMVLYTKVLEHFTIIKKMNLTNDNKVK